MRLALRLVINVQVSYLSQWSLKVRNWYRCSHAHISNHPPADFAIHCNTLRTAKEQPDMTSDIRYYFHLPATGLFLWRPWVMRILWIEPFFFSL